MATPVCKEASKCRLCKREGLKPVIDLGLQYVVDFVPDPMDSKLVRVPLKMVRCTKCGLVQLQHTVNPDLLYRKFWYRSAINEQMRMALNHIVECAMELVQPEKGDAVLDIGANDGTLLGWYPGVVKTVGIDPCAELMDEAWNNKRADVVIRDYFSAEKVKAYGPYKIITAIAMFYDLDDPVEFLRQCKSVLAPDGVLVIQMNYLMGMLTNFAVDNIAHEHLTYYSLHTLKTAVEAAGLDIVGAQENDVNGGSFRVYVSHPNFSPKAPNSFSVDIVLKAADMMLKEWKAALDGQEIYSKFEQGIKDKCSALKTYLNKLASEEARIYIYGASTRGTVLMQLLDLGKGVIQGCAERDEKKFGLHMIGGTWPKIYPEDYVRSRATHFLVLPWHFKQSVVKREEQWLRSGGKMIFPLPTPHVQSFGSEPVYIGYEPEPQPAMEELS